MNGEGAPKMSSSFIVLFVKMRFGSSGLPGGLWGCGRAVPEVVLNCKYVGNYNGGPWLERDLDANMLINIVGALGLSVAWTQIC